MSEWNRKSPPSPCPWLCELSNLWPVSSCCLVTCGPLTFSIHPTDRTGDCLNRFNKMRNTYFKVNFSSIEINDTASKKSTELDPCFDRRQQNDDIYSSNERALAAWEQPVCCRVSHSHMADSVSHHFLTNCSLSAWSRKALTVCLQLKPSKNRVKVHFLYLSLDHTSWLWPFTLYESILIFL